MNADDMGWVGSLIKTVESVFNQMQAWPSAVLLFVVLTLMGVLLYSFSVVLHRFSAHVPEHQTKFERLSLTIRYLAPVSVVIVGSWLNTVLGDVGSVAPNQRNPHVILAMWGFCISFASWIAAWIVYKRIGKLLPIPTNGKPGDTTFIDKPKDE